MLKILQCADLTRRHCGLRGHGKLRGIARTVHVSRHRQLRHYRRGRSCSGPTGVVTKLLALPTFCVVVLLLRLLHYRLVDRSWPVLKTFLGLQILLLGLGAVLAIRHGSFSKGDDWAAMITGLVLVAGMAVQNALQRVHLSGMPPTTIMTGTTTQIMLDLGDLVLKTDEGQKDVLYARLTRMGQVVLAFASGCALAALLYATLGMWVLCVASSPCARSLSPWGVITRDYLPMRSVGTSTESPSISLFSVCDPAAARAARTFHGAVVCPIVALCQTRIERETS